MPSEVIIHCSSSGFGNAVLIDSWHAERGFKTPSGIHIGYHFVILNGQLSAKKHNSAFDGCIETGRPLDDDNIIQPDEIGAHALGYNKNSIGICLIGLSGQFTKAQLRSLRYTISVIKKQFGEIKVFQHSDKDPVNKPYCAGLTSIELIELNQI